MVAGAPDEVDRYIKWTSDRGILNDSLTTLNSGTMPEPGGTGTAAKCGMYEDVIVGSMMVLSWLRHGLKYFT